MEITGILRSMKEEVHITTERIDDFVVLLALMQQMDLPGILDRQIARHRFQQGLSWGWVASIWLAHIVSQGDHRKLTVRDWVRQAHSTLERVTGLDIRETDFTDDRLTIVLRHLSHESCWYAIEQELGQHLVRVYGTRIPVEIVLQHLAYDLSLETLFADYPYLTKEDVQACLAYAETLVEDEELFPLEPNQQEQRHVNV